MTFLTKKYEILTKNILINSAIKEIFMSDWEKDLFLIVFKNFILKKKLYSKIINQHN